MAPKRKALPNHRHLVIQLPTSLLELIRSKSGISRTKTSRHIIAKLAQVYAIEAHLGSEAWHKLLLEIEDTRLKRLAYRN